MDLISRDALIKKMFPYGMPDNGNYGINARVVMEAVMGVPAVEAEPVVHAHWVDRYGYKYANKLFVCSRCGKKALFEIEKDCLGSDRIVQSFTDRCPECGAHMDEEVA